MQVLVRVFHVSAIVEPLADVEVQVILGASQIWNRRRDITGMLARSDGHFAQVVEGRREAIDALLDEPVTRRKLAHWAMGLAQPKQLQPGGFPGARSGKFPAMGSPVSASS